jgi:hypothetical protein
MKFRIPIQLLDVTRPKERTMNQQDICSIISLVARRA